MPQKTVVFVGDHQQLTTLRGYNYRFEQNGWKTLESTSISEAQQQEQIDLLVVWAYSDYYVEDFERWKNPPPTIWYLFSNGDNWPLGITSLRHTQPKELFQKAEKLLEEEKGGG